MKPKHLDQVKWMKEHPNEWKQIGFFEDRSKAMSKAYHIRERVLEAFRYAEWETRVKLRHDVWFVYARYIKR